MTFDTGVPNSGQSPGFFPAQNQTNMTRIKANINADHNFLDTSAVDEGAHKQTTFINRPNGYVPAFPVGTNAVLYTLFDANNESQLHYYNGVTDEILTPNGKVGPIINAGTTGAAILPVNPFLVTGLPAQYVATGFVWEAASTNRAFYNLSLIAGVGDTNEIDRQGSSQGPLFSFSGANLYVVCGRISPIQAKILQWSIVVSEVV